MVRTRSDDTTTTKATKSTTSSAPRGKEAQAIAARWQTGYQFVAGVVLLVGLWYGWEQWLVSRLGLNRLHVHTMADRVAFGLRWQLLPLSWVVVSLLEIVYTRFTTHAITGAASSEHLLDTATDTLANTLQNYQIFAVTQLILATHLPEVQLKLVPLLSIVFFLARFIYYVTNHVANRFQTTGTIITVLPTILAFAWSAYLSWTLGVHHHLGAGVSTSQSPRG